MADRLRYDSFTMRLEPGRGPSCDVFVQSPRGEGQGRAVSRLSPQGASALEVGKALFRAVFQDEVANLFHASLGGLGKRKEGLRIEVVIDPRDPASADLQALPWERLCRPDTEDFLCLSRLTPVVRTLEAHRERRPPIALPNPIRILVVAASPTDRAALDVMWEHANLEEAWKGTRVELVFLRRGGIDEIRQAGEGKAIHILHFMGHGELDPESGEGALLFEGSDGTAQRFDGRRLAQQLHDFKSLRLVVLNACRTAQSAGTRGANPFAGTASALALGGVPAVVAMNGCISDPAAIAFSRTLYRRLAVGDPIEAAMTEGRLAIQRLEAAAEEWATPILYLRGSEGALFAPRSTLWARRIATLAGMAVTLVLLWILSAGWRRESREAEVLRRTNEGVGLLATGKREEARQALLSALELDAESATVLGNLAVVEMQLGLADEALEHARDAARVAPEEAVHHYNLGNLLSLRRRYEEALPNLLQAVKLAPRYLSAYNELGNVYLALDRPAEARHAFQTGLAYDQGQPKLHKNLGRVALAEERLDEAISHLETALSLYPAADPLGKAESSFWLASAQARAGRRDEACAALKQLRLFDPNLLGPFAANAQSLARRSRCAAWP